MKAFVPRGVALNLDYLRSTALGYQPHIYVEIDPSQWEKTANGYQFKTPNKIRSLGPALFYTFNLSDESRVYTSLQEASDYITVGVHVVPAYSIALVGLAVNKCVEASVLLTPADFVWNGSAYVHTIPLTNNGEHYLSEMETETADSAVYIHHFHQDASLLIESTNLPTINIRVRTYYPSE